MFFQKAKSKKQKSKKATSKKAKKQKAQSTTKSKKQFSKKGFIQGFMIAFLNPKILVFLVAVFSQFINSDINSLDRFIIAIMASFIDMAWYVLVSLLLAGTSLINSFRANVVLIDRSIGSILILISLLLIKQTIS